MSSGPLRDRRHSEAGVAVVVGHRRHRLSFELLWQVFLRCSDVENTFRLFKRTLGWTCPKIRSPERPTAGLG
ncbi:hypothetical protein AAW14_00540 [Streptomyces hygroscopicus]|uniref:hypothetical protein n=1 Tax=Streptomyces hygroscopicus TaxID=1912 RepID=UPI003A0FFCF1|nr:hypothetical protein [Streptomyces hygroscopicus]